MKLSCTSVMLPHWSLDETFDRLANCGFDGIELRCRYNPEDKNIKPSFWGRHLSDVSPNNIHKKADKIRKAVARSGVRVIALAPNVTFEKTEIIHKIFKGALAIDPNNPPAIRIGAPRHDRNFPYHPQFLKARSGFAELVEVARNFGIKILYEIHVGTIAVSCSRTIELLKDLDPNHIGAIYDVPNMIRVGLEDSRMGMEILGPYLEHCHIGNATPTAQEPDETGRKKWTWTFSDLREGLADIPQIIQDLKDVGYTGYLSLEDFGSGDDLKKIRDQSSYLKSLIG